MAFLLWYSSLNLFKFYSLDLIFSSNSAICIYIILIVTLANCSAFLLHFFCFLSFRIHLPKSNPIKVNNTATIVKGIHSFLWNFLLLCPYSAWSSHSCGLLGSWLYSNYGILLSSLLSFFYISFSCLFFFSSCFCL